MPDIEFFYFCNIRQPRNVTVVQAVASIYRAFRNGVLPLLVFYVFLSKIVGLEADSAAMRAIATLFWISVIYAVLLLVNVMLFAQAAPNSWRARAPKLFQDLVRVLLVVIGAAIVLSVVWRRDLGGLERYIKVEHRWGESLYALIADAGVDAGADLVIGPLEKPAVASLASRTSLPVMSLCTWLAKITQLSRISTTLVPL